MHGNNHKWWAPPVRSGPSPPCFERVCAQHGRLLPRSSSTAGAQRFEPCPLFLCYAARTHVPMCVLMPARVKPPVLVGRRRCAAVRAPRLLAVGTRRTHLLCTGHALDTCFDHALHIPQLWCRFATLQHNKPESKQCCCLTRRNFKPSTRGAGFDPAAPIMYGCLHAQHTARVQSRINGVNPKRLLRVRSGLRFASVCLNPAPLCTNTWWCSFVPLWNNCPMKVQTRANVPVDLHRIEIPNLVLVEFVFSNFIVGQIHF